MTDHQVKLLFKLVDGKKKDDQDRRFEGGDERADGSFVFEGPQASERAEEGS